MLFSNQPDTMSFYKLSYINMIAHVIGESPNRMLCLADIYNQLKCWFPISFQDGTRRTWENSVRHTLSYNLQFQRIDVFSLMHCGRHERRSFWINKPGMECHQTVGSVTIDHAPDSRLASTGRINPSCKRRRISPPTGEHYASPDEIYAAKLLMSLSNSRHELAI